MLKISLYFLIIYAAVFFFSSCKKTIDFIREHPDAYRTPCRITNYRVVAINGVYSNYVVTYNNVGNPVNMMDSDRVNPIGTDQYFRYDKLNRLSDYMSAYAPNLGAIEWHKYVYQKPGYIIDTAMYYETGDVRGPSPIAKNTTEYSIFAYTMDELDRIVKIWSIPIDSPHTPLLKNIFIYDANGNLPLPDTSLVYDNKVNFFRTNQVWQFIYKNYSRSNLILRDGSFAPQYNDFGLPLIRPNLERWYIYPFNQWNYSEEAFVDYSCSITKEPVYY